MEIREALYDKLKSLKIEAYVYDDGVSGKVLTFRGPTWCVNPKTPLETFTDSFVQDEDGAMRDYAAVPGLAIDSFFKDPEIITRNALSRAQWQPINPITLEIDSDFRPIVGFNYFVGVDLSTGGGDATGIAMVYYNFIDNKIVMPVNFRITADKGSFIDYAAINQMIYSLRDRGFNIKKVAFDQFQSHQTILEMNSNGIAAEKLNYSETFAGCSQLRELIQTGQFEYYLDQDEFIGEAQHLVVKSKGTVKRIDHPSSGPWANRKDCWDAAVNASVCAVEDYYNSNEVKMAKANQTASKVLDYMLSSQRQRNPDLDDIRWIL